MEKFKPEEGSENTFPFVGKKKMIKLPENPTIELGEGTPVNTGDMIQWISQGAEMFEEPKKVTGISEDEKIIFVEGEKTGFPTEQMKIMRRK